MTLDLVVPVLEELSASLPFSFADIKINQIALKDNWFYISTLAEYEEFHVKNGVPRTVYSFNEWYMFYTDSYTYWLEIQTPSLEPIRRGNQFLALNKWLSNFKVIVQD